MSIIIMVIIICLMHESWTMCHESIQDAGDYINRQSLPMDPMSDANWIGGYFFSGTRYVTVLSTKIPS